MKDEFGILVDKLVCFFLSYWIMFYIVIGCIFVEFLMGCRICIWLDILYFDLLVKMFEKMKFGNYIICCNFLFGDLVMVRDY